MSLDKKILTILNPLIKLDEMTTLDTEDKEKSPILSSDKYSKQAGSLYPLIMINKHKIPEGDVVSMTIDETGFIPKVRVSFVTSDGIFLSKFFPKDGDPLSLFIRSKKDEFKPIRNDYDILDVHSSPSADETGDHILFTIEGVLRIPGLYAEHCKAFKNSTSFDALLNAAKDMKIGFASNETATQDSQTWICPFDTYEKFVKDVTSASYKDDDSFFKSWIDHYYCLNFVNANNQFSDEFEVEDALEVLGSDYLAGQEHIKQETKLMLTNHGHLKGQDAFIEKYTLLNSAGQVVIDNGYRRYLQFYDHFFDAEGEKKYQSHFIEPLNTKNVSDKILLRGRVGEDIMEKTSKHKWMGAQYALPKGNVHENYSYSILQNWQNSQEINKLVLHVVLPRCNFNIYRGQRIPIVIITVGDQKRKAANQEPEQAESESFAYDKFLTGYYMVAGMRYTWNSDDAVFRHQLYCTRREWPIPTQ